MKCKPLLLSTAGFIEKLTIKIPWTQLTKEPIIIEVDGLYLLAVPSSFADFSADVEEEKVCVEG